MTESTKLRLSDIESECAATIKSLGYDYFHYAGYFPVFESQKNLCSFPSSYSELGVLDIGDRNNPLVVYAQTKTAPSQWTNMPSDTKMHGKQLEQLLISAEKNQIHNGYCVPVHGAGSEWGMLNVAKKEATLPASADTISQLQLLVISIHEAMRRLHTANKHPAQHTKLSPREQECLNWTAAGKTAWETAQIIGITESTVSFHIRNTITKLNASNRSHAVAVAMARSLLTGRHEC